MCSAANRNMRIMRARFSALIPRELQRAMQQLVPPNAADAAAVDARQEIDLRVGASFTRMQTMLLQVGGLPCWCGQLHKSCLSRRGDCCIEPCNSNTNSNSFGDLRQPAAHNRPALQAGLRMAEGGLQHRHSPHSCTCRAQLPCCCARLAGSSCSATSNMLRWHLGLRGQC